MPGSRDQKQAYENYGGDLYNKPRLACQVSDNTSVPAPALSRAGNEKVERRFFAARMRAACRGTDSMESVLSGWSVIGDPESVSNDHSAGHAALR
jgi:hypothetical protein